MADKTTDAVNRILRLSSFQTVNQIDEGDQRSNMALNTLTQARKDVLVRPVDFNEFVLDLPVDNSGKVPVPSVYLSVTLPNPRHAVKVDSDDGLHYVYDVANDEWHDSPISRVEVRTDVAFEKIPNIFAQWITWEAVEQFYAEHRGEPTAYIQRKRGRAKAKAMNSLPPKTMASVKSHRRIAAVYIGE